MTTIQDNTAKKELIFYFDYLSPYAFLAWKRLHDVVKKYNLTLKPEPVLLGAVLNHWGIKAPADVRPKKEHIFKEVMRLASKRNITLNFPPEHPFKPIPSLRATCLMKSDNRYFEFVDYLFEAIWMNGKDLGKKENVLEILEKFGIENPDEKINDNYIKSMLREITDSAVSKNVFGVPTMIYDNELFWGDSSIIYLEDYLKGEDNFNKGQLVDFMNRPSGITP